MQPYYEIADQDWSRAARELTATMSECLDSSEYFALLGAAQMNNGQTTEALESLERALLLDPDNGAAAVDYAQTLYIAGQLFPALEINQRLLQRADIPPNLAVALNERQQLWQAQTRTKGYAAEIAAGYDDNLNGAPSRSELALTLTGEDIQLTLDPEYQPVSGGYLNLRLSGYYRALTPERSHQLTYVLRNRRSDHSASELLQFDWRYEQGLSLRRYRWNFTGGTSHLLYGGSPLYSVTEGRALLGRLGTGCMPQYELAAQHQLYHGQSAMAGLEASLTAGLNCSSETGMRSITIDLGPVLNHALRDERPGSDRRGWRARLVWQQALGRGVLDAQLSYARLDDQTGYSELLADGAPREIDSRFFRLQYRRPVAGNLLFLASLTHQGQGSNLTPFKSDGTAVDFGLSLSF